LKGGKEQNQKGGGKRRKNEANNNKKGEKPCGEGRETMSEDSIRRKKERKDVNPSLAVCLKDRKEQPNVENAT